MIHFDFLAQCVDALDRASEDMMTIAHSIEKNAEAIRKVMDEVMTGAVPNSVEPNFPELVATEEGGVKCNCSACAAEQASKIPGFQPEGYQIISFDPMDPASVEAFMKLISDKFGAK